MTRKTRQSSNASLSRGGDIDPNATSTQPPKFGVELSMPPQKQEVPLGSTKAQEPQTPPPKQEVPSSSTTVQEPQTPAQNQEVLLGFIGAQGPQTTDSGMSWGMASYLSEPPKDGGSTYSLVHQWMYDIQWKDLDGNGALAEKE